MSNNNDTCLALRDRIDFLKDAVQEHRWDHVTILCQEIAFGAKVLKFAEEYSRHLKEFPDEDTTGCPGK